MLQSRHPPAQSTAPAERPLRNRKSRSQNTTPAQRPLHGTTSRPPRQSKHHALAVALKWRRWSRLVSSGSSCRPPETA
eukprot:4772362-Alexandrium_andersonii.AAC.1